MIGGIIGIGAINQIPATPKTDYEMAFEHFLGKKYINEINSRVTKEDWDMMDENERETALLSAIKDPDMALEYIDSTWNELPEEAKSNMTIVTLDEVSMNEDYDGLDPNDYDLMDDGSMIDPETGKVVWSPERGRIKEDESEKNSLEDYFKKIKFQFPDLGTKEFNDLASAYFGGNPNNLSNNPEEGKEIEEPNNY
jgi:hypothetical protein